MGLATQTTSVYEEVLQFNADRKRAGVLRKLERMDENAFAFFRGAAHLFGRSWSALKPPDLGPNLLICGDLHLENFGAYRTDAGDFLYDINDFDESLFGPCSLDLVRCATSILLAAQLWQLTPVQAMRILLAFLDRYRSSVAKVAERGRVREVSLRTGGGPIRHLLARTVLANQAKLLDRHTELLKSGFRRIRRIPEEHPPISQKKSERISEAVEQYGQWLGKPEAFQVLDVTGRIAGLGSLGLRRYSVLVVGDGAPHANRLLDLKEARPSSLLASIGIPQPPLGENPAAWAVTAQRQIQARPVACLGWLEIGRRFFRVRELIPSENRSRLDRLRENPAKLRRAVEVAGRLTAWAHVRGGRLGGADATAQLAQWASGPALDAVLASAVRYAEQTRQQYRQFQSAYARLGSPAPRGL